MDQHPIPQDVTGFQFKLIGSMTVKQFGYVAFGVISAVILYYLPLHSPFGILLKVVLIPLFGSSGFIIAFVPIEGRPIDIMTSNFVKALFSPNQYIYKKQGRKLSFMTISFAPVAAATQEGKGAAKPPTKGEETTKKEKQLQAYLLSSAGKGHNAQDEKEQAFLRSFATIASPIPTTTAAIPQPATQHVTPQPVLRQQPLVAHTGAVAATPAPHPLPTPSVAPIATPPPPAPKDTRPAAAPVPTQTVPPAQPETHPQMQQLEQQMQQAHQQRRQLEQELTQLKSQLAAQVKPAAQQQPQPNQHVIAIPQDMTKKLGLPHTSDTPNVVVGIVKDPRGNILPSMLVEVKDHEGNPVRAFKTNALGQFASATPLPNGMYAIELEDPKKLQQFDTIQITASGQIMLPIEIISHDAREELRKQLFN